MHQLKQDLHQFEHHLHQFENHVLQLDFHLFHVLLLQLQLHFEFNFVNSFKLKTVKDWILRMFQLLQFEKCVIVPQEHSNVTASQTSTKSSLFSKPQALLSVLELHSQQRKRIGKCKELLPHISAYSFHVVSLQWRKERESKVCDGKEKVSTTLQLKSLDGETLWWYNADDWVLGRTRKFYSQHWLWFKVTVVEVKTFRRPQSRNFLSWKSFLFRRLRFLGILRLVNDECIALESSGWTFSLI